MKFEKKILLLNPGAFKSNWARYLEVKPHLVYLYSALKKYFEVEIVDLEIELGRPFKKLEIAEYKKKGLALIEKHDFDILAISCYTSVQYLASLFFAKKIKKKFPSKLIVVGGYHPTQVPSDFNYTGSPFDQVVMGDVDNWVHWIIKKKEFDSKKKKHTIRALKKDADILVPVLPNQILYYKKQKINTVELFLSKGCPFNCNYCMEFRKSWRFLNVKTAINLINETAKKIKPKKIVFSDACFGVNKSWRRKFLYELIKLNLKNHYWIETRHELLDKKDIDLFSKLNIQVDLGVDSFSKNMLKIMNKTSDPINYLKKFLKINKWLNNKKINHRIYLLLNHPGETIKTLEQTLSFIQDHFSEFNKYIFIGFQNYSYFPGSTTYRKIKFYEKKYGTKISYKKWWKMDGNQDMYSRKIIPSADSIKKKYKIVEKKLIKLISEINNNSKIYNNPYGRY